VDFEWDSAKAASNLAKHGVSFREALTVFEDPLAVIFEDEEHSRGELREIIIGHSDQSRLLLACFTERSGKVRIINARPATRRERDHYEKSARF
jgi:uncharacterized DUF497 family protein